jgi:type II secretory pathway pseudopilin PulG
MRVGINTQGYTIMEVMIFLAVSGFMFVIAATLIQGKQQKTEFRQSMNASSAQIQGVINDVNNGFFPSNAGFSCTSDDTGNMPVLGPPVTGSDSQGTKKGCVFMGKVMMFGGYPDAGRGYSLFTMAGRQYKGSMNAAVIPSSFAEAKPRAVTGSPDFELTEHDKLEGGTKLTKVFSGASTNTLDGIGFYTSFGSYDSGGTLQSGSQDVIVVAIPGSGNFDPDTAHMATEAQGNSIDSNVLANPDITMCFYGGNDQYATIVLGGPGGQRLATHIQYFNSNPGYC